MITEGKIPVNEILTFTEKIRGILVKDGKMSSLFPDHPDIVDQVVIHPPGSPWE